MVEVCEAVEAPTSQVLEKNPRQPTLVRTGTGTAKNSNGPLTTVNIDGPPRQEGFARVNPKNQSPEAG